MNSSAKSEPGQLGHHTVLVSAAHYVPAFLGGGPIQTLKALIKAAPPAFTSTVICANHDLGETTPLVDRPNEWVDVDTASVRYVQGGIRPLIEAFRSVGHADIVYLNSLLNPRYSILPMVLKRIGFWRNGTILIAPRGELDPGALALKSRKKTLFITAFRLLRMHKSVLWHASTGEEANQIKSVFGDVTVLIRENETSLPDSAVTRSPRSRGPARLLFVSRLHEKKGLHVLLEALVDVTQPVELNIVGAFEDHNYEARCRSLIENLNDNIAIIFSGALVRDDVLTCMQAADLMVFPTAGENFGHVIAEALSQSCPVMCSTHTPWTERLDNGGGAAVKPNTPKTWTKTLESFLSKGPDDWEAAASRAGRSFDTWRNEDKGQHIFQLALAELDRNRGS